MQHLIYHRSMESITSIEHVLNFRSEELIFDLREIEILVPEFTDRFIQDRSLEFGIFNGDAVKPEYVSGTSDIFFIMTKTGQQRVDPTVFKSLKDVYLYSNNFKQLNVKPETAINLVKHFGPDVRMGRSKIAIRKIIACWTLFLYLKTEEVYSCDQEMKLPALDKIYSPANVEKWREFYIQNYQGQRHPRTGAPLDQPVEEDFQTNLLRSLNKHMGSICKGISLFVDRHRDCFYSVEVNGEQFSIIRGIDHKYIPYYEQKFSTELNNDEKTRLLYHRS